MSRVSDPAVPITNPQSLRPEESTGTVHTTPLQDEKTGVEKLVVVVPREGSARAAADAL